MKDMFGNDVGSNNMLLGDKSGSSGDRGPGRQGEQGARNVRTGESVGAKKEGTVFRHIGLILFGLILFGMFSFVRSMIQDREEDEQIQAQLNAIGYELMAEMQKQSDGSARANFGESVDSALEKAGFEAQHAAAGEDGESIEPPRKRPPVPSKRGRLFGKLDSVESTAAADVEEQPALPPSRMVLKSSSVKGTIDIGAVEAIIKEQLPNAQECYDLERRSHGVGSGSVSLKWTINPDGSVGDSEVSRSTLKSETVESCILVIYSMQSYPESSSEATVKVTLEMGI